MIFDISVNFADGKNSHSFDSQGHCVCGKTASVMQLNHPLTVESTSSPLYLCFTPEDTHGYVFSPAITNKCYSECVTIDTDLQNNTLAFDGEKNKTYYFYLNSVAQNTEVNINYGNGHTFNEQNECTVCGLTQSSGDSVCGEDLLWSLSNEGVLTIYPDPTDQTPRSVYNMYSHSSPSDYPWNNVRDKIKSVKISNKLEKIENYAFKNCPNLKILDIPDDSILNSFGVSCFENCGSLETVIFPDSLSEINLRAFSGCENCSIKKVNIDSNISYIGDYVFAHWKNLEEITINCRNFYDLSYLGEYCFADCPKLKKLNIYNPKEVIFRGLYELRELTFDSEDDSEFMIVNNAFYDSYNLSSVVFSDKCNVSYIQNRAFNCASLKEINLPSTIRYFVTAK